MSNPAPGYPEIKLYIDGQWTDGGGGRGDDVVNPATEEVIGRVPFAEHGDVEAAIAAAKAAFPKWRAAGPDFRSGILLKAAALLHSLVRNHALVDGNKRLAWAATRVFCILNGRDLTYSVDEAEQLMLAAAAGDLDVPELARWLSGHHC